MKKILLITLLATFIYACGGGEPPKKTPKKTTSTKKAVDGEKVYKQYCVTCHGTGGDMAGSGAYDLTKTKLSVAEKITVISNGRNTMLPYKNILSEEKIKAVAEYTEQFKK